MIVLGALALLLALSALGVAAWALVRAETEAEGRRGRAAAVRGAEALLDALAHAALDQPTDSFRLRNDLALLDPPEPRPFAPTAEPADAEARFYIELAGRRIAGSLPGGSDGGIEPPISARTALELAMESEDAASRLAAAVRGIALELREGSGNESVWFGRLGDIGPLHRTAEYALAVAQESPWGFELSGPGFWSSARAAIGTRDDIRAVSMLIGTGKTDMADIRAARERIADALSLRDELRAIDALGEIPKLLLLSDGRACACEFPSSAQRARNPDEHYWPLTRDKNGEINRGTRAHVVSSAAVAALSQDILTPRGTRLVGTARIASTDHSVRLPGGHFAVVSDLPESAESRSGVLLGGLLLAALASLAAFIGFARGARRAARLATLRSEFVATVGHELRTPVAVVRTAAETLALGRAGSDETRAELVAAILSESERLSNLLGNVLDFARMEAGERRFRFREEGPADVARRAHEAHLGALSGVGFTIEEDLDEDLPALRCDAAALGAAIGNLLENAAKFSPDRRDATLRVRQDGGRVVFEVEDHGVGVPDAEKPEVFDRFFRGTSESVRDTRGTGIGLALVRHAAEAHGGHAEVVDTQGGGATFRIVVPRPGHSEQQEETP